MSLIGEVRQARGIDTETNGVLFTTRIPCGAGEDLREAGSDHYIFTIPADPASIPEAAGYDYYFCVAVGNALPQERVITLQAMRPDHLSREAKWTPSRVPVFVSADSQTWYVLDEVDASQNHEEYRMQVVLPPRQTVYLSNSLPHPSRIMALWLSRVQAAHNELVLLHRLGPSVEGRQVLLLTISDPAVADPSKDRILVTSGFHPAEPDWLATTAIIDWLLSDDPQAKKTRQDFVVDVLTQVNPDGFDLGTNGANAQGVNLYWDFRPDDEQNSPEAVRLWRWIEAHPPHLYLDFHAYVHQLHKDYRPYIRSRWDYVPSARPAARAIDRELVKLCAGRQVRGRVTSLPTTLAAQMTDAFGTITYPKFHLHLAHGIRACEELGVAVFRTVVENASGFRPLSTRVAPMAGAHGGGRTRPWLQRWDRSVTATRLRSLEQRVNRHLHVHTPLARLRGRPWSGLDLAPDWTRHLWSRRDQLNPVIVIGDARVTALRQSGTRSGPCD
jgi:hypothetical protein